MNSISGDWNLYNTTNSPILLNLISNIRHVKIAILICGYLRSFRDNIESIKTNILNTEHAEIDIYIHITQTSEKKYLNDKFKIDEIYTHFKPKIVIISDNIKFNNKYENLYNQNYKFWMLNKRRQEIEKMENIKYDIIMKLRPDVNLQERITFLQSNPTMKDCIYIPSDTKIDKTKLMNETDPYMCDIIAYGPPHLMDQYFDIYQELDHLIPKYGATNETLLYYHLSNKQIPYQFIDIQYIVILSKINTIAITGDSGCGKTSLSNILKRLFDSSFILECDRYHKWERGHEKWQTITHLNPKANYITKMNDDVFDLKIGRDIYQVDYDHKTGKFTDKQIIENKDNIIICGLHTLYLSDHVLDLKIYIDAADSVRIPWKIKRDVTKRGYTIDRILKQIEDRKADYEQYILPQREKADIIISFYNDNQFNIESFDINMDVKFKYKIGINRKYNLNDIMRRGLEVKKIEYADKNDNFYWLYFKEDENFENIITQTILSFFVI